MNELEKIGHYMAKSKVEVMKAKRALTIRKEDHLEEIRGLEREIKDAEKRVADAEEILKIMMEEGVPMAQAAIIQKTGKA